MRTHWIDRDGLRLHAQEDGSPTGPALIFANSLATDLTLWDGVVAHLSENLRILRYDMRGHGRSDVPDPPYTMGALIADAEAICDALNVRDAVMVGLSVGGMVAQGLAIKRLDLLRGMVLSNTAAKIGTPAIWQDRIDALEAGGMAALTDAILDRWFGPRNTDTPLARAWREKLLAVDPKGYAGVSAAISGTDFYTPTSGLRLPTLGIAGANDGATPPDLVRETVDLIPGSRFELMRRCGHLPCIEDPEGYARILTTFLTDIGHI